jgi:mannose-6-phosphate isomerase-like protein (cupin superfamily)
MIKDKYKLDTLPITKDFLKEKRLLEKRGELALISDGMTINHLGYFSLGKGNGYFRGRHYHKNKVEHFYIISGSLTVLLMDVDSKEKEEILITAGNRLTIFPFRAHVFYAREFSQAIEYYASPYDPTDDFSYDFGL